MGEGWGWVLRVQRYIWAWRWMFDRHRTCWLGFGVDLGQSADCSTQSPPVPARTSRFPAPRRRRHARGRDCGSRAQVHGRTHRGCAARSRVHRVRMQPALPTCRACTCPGSFWLLLLAAPGTPAAHPAAAPSLPRPAGRLWPRHDEDRAAIKAAGLDCDTILGINDLCKGDDVRRHGGEGGRRARGGASGAGGACGCSRLIATCCLRRHLPTRPHISKLASRLDTTPKRQVFFAATGVSDSDLVKGVRYYAGGASTSSIVMRARSGTVRFIETQHRCAAVGGGRGCVDGWLNHDGWARRPAATSVIGPLRACASSVQRPAARACSRPYKQPAPSYVSCAAPFPFSLLPQLEAPAREGLLQLSRRLERETPPPAPWIPSTPRGSAGPLPADPASWVGPCPHQELLRSSQ